MYWAVMATIQAEEFGMTSENVDEFLESENPDIARFLGQEEGNGAILGLDEDFAYQIIKQMGNYGEIFERNIGSDSPFNLERGLNALYTDGGILYSPPFRFILWRRVLGASRKKAHGRCNYTCVKKSK